MGTVNDATPMWVERKKDLALWIFETCSNHDMKKTITSGTIQSAVMSAGEFIYHLSIHRMPKPADVRYIEKEVRRLEAERDS
jgi:hypothetical protein